jgi:predicted phosphodiesterase
VKAVEAHDLVDGVPLAVVSDIHSNAFALNAALKQIRDRRINRLMVLGDLFTYGCHPNEVTDLLESATDLTLRFVCGNHDLLYPCGGDEYVATLPDFIRESVEWTRAELNGRVPQFEPATEITAGMTLFAHANPFTFGDWTYLNSASSVVAAADALSHRGLRLAVVGHTHRRRVSIVSATGRVDEGDTGEIVFRNPFRGSVVNAGSVGQPRGTGASMLFLSLTDDRAELEFVDLRYDVSAHIARIAECSLSQGTKERLLSFFAA